ncbi:MAG: tetratricopeptide repeat protein [Planctomycetota bacterium]|nr:MAG: tetratricopeptide repeat protein [Planctomycetota bacterium]
MPIISRGFSYLSMKRNSLLQQRKSFRWPKPLAQAVLRTGICWVVPACLWLGLPNQLGSLLTAITAEAFAQQDVGIPQEDPFSDELNPFGSGTQNPNPAPSLPAAPRKPALQLPVPFPDRTVSGEPADRKKTIPTKPPSNQKPAVEMAVPDLFGDTPSPTDRAKADRRPSSGSQEMGRGPFENGGLGDEQSPATELLHAAEKLDKEGQFEQSREVLRKAVKLDPSLTVASLALGVVSRRLGDYEGAVEAFSKGLVVDPDEPELYLRRGVAWFHLGLYGIALEDFEDAAGIAYDDPRPELWRGLTLMELKRPLEAINAYASAIRRDRTYMLAYLNRGLGYLATDEPRKAEFDFDHAIRHNPRDIRAWFNRGVAQAQQGRLGDAVNSYSEALKIDPTHEPSLRNRNAAQRMKAQTP